MTRRALAMTGLVAASVTLVGLVIYLSAIGLDRADKLSSSISMFLALAGLGLSGYGLARSRSIPAPPSSPAGAERASEERGTQANPRTMYAVASDNATQFTVGEGMINVHYHGTQQAVRRDPDRSEPDPSSTG